TEHVEAVVILEHRLEGHNGPEADETGDSAENDRAKGAGKASGRGDGNETGNSARDKAEGRSVTAGDLFADGPCDSGSGRCGDGVEEGLGSKTVGAESGTSVEAKPTNPEKAGADIGPDQVMGSNRLLEVTKT